MGIGSGYKIFLFLFLICASKECLSAKTAQQIFTQIYKQKAWGSNGKGEGSSGGGSQIEHATKYVEYLNSFIKEKGIKSIVDLGCGDWQIMQHVDLTDIDYLGMDVVRAIVQRNINQYSSPNIKFALCDATKMDLPKADLLICKDVIAHCSNSDVFRIINHFKAYKHILITADVDPSTRTALNYDIFTGGWRQIDISAPPFNQIGKKVLTYLADSSESRKQVFHIHNEVQ